MAASTRFVGASLRRHIMGRITVLKGLDPLLTPDLLHVLAQMGHGDVLALVDRNYPAHSTNDRVIRLDGTDLPGAARAILSVLPIDSFIAEPVAGMAPVDDPEAVPQVQADVLALVEAAEGRRVGCERVERFAFYQRVRSAFAVVLTTEARPYGCVLLTKGVVFD